MSGTDKQAGKAVLLKKQVTGSGKGVGNKVG